MRADVLSQRIFTAGCFGLPWLWVVHVLYERGLDEAGNSENSEDPTNQGLLDADERTLLCFGLLCFWLLPHWRRWMLARLSMVFLNVSCAFY